MRCAAISARSSGGWSGSRVIGGEAISQSRDDFSTGSGDGRRTGSASRADNSVPSCFLVRQHVVIYRGIRDRWLLNSQSAALLIALDCCFCGGRGARGRFGPILAQPSGLTRADEGGDNSGRTFPRADGHGRFGLHLSLKI